MVMEIFKKESPLEAIQLAGTQKLDNLVIVHDFNNMQIDSSSSEVNDVDFKQFFKAQKFNVMILKSNEPEEIIKALEKTKKLKFNLYSSSNHNCFWY
ncbi:hypothetical protein [Mycoplasmopsis cynos]|uniref:hypothetical protein n=1 Tax=Mycoplasmopsis cynos TaxID=171284 RepID=UPI002FF0C035